MNEDDIAILKVALLGVCIYTLYMLCLSAVVSFGLFLLGLPPFLAVGGGVFLAIVYQIVVIMRSGKAGHE